VDEQFTCQAQDRFIVARLHGEPNERVLEECQSCVLELAKLNGCRAVLYDLRDMEAPPLKVLLYQRILNSHLGDFDLRRAVVVPNAHLGYLARLAFGGADYRVFYDDMEAAKKCLADGDGAANAVWGTTVKEERRVGERRASAARKLSGRRHADGGARLHH
jgi:hypothetical protein